jgi:GntR family transcriptional regulator
VAGRLQALAGKAALNQIPVEFRDKQPIYLQIADHICESILQGKWHEGERIPSVRELAVILEVNPHTILRSFDFLLNKDIIFNKRGLGYSASHSARALISAYRKQRFMEKELPIFFSSLVLLDIGIDEITVRYNEFVSKNNPVNL